MPDYSEDLEIAIGAAQAAAEIIREYNRNRDFGLKFKGKNDIVTDADLASEKKILEIIRNAFPEDQVMAEETANERHLPEGRIWMIDPIDGTTNFAHGFPVYCVSIALWDQKVPKAGVVLEVSHNELFRAEAGKGAYLNGRRLQVSGLDKPPHALIGTGFPYNDLSLKDNYLVFFEWLMHHTQGIRRPGAAAYDLCCVAAARYDGFYEYSLNPWDVGAAALIVQEAGGVITDWEGEQNWLLGKRIVAGNPVIHQFLLEGLQQHFTPKELQSLQR